MHKNINSLLGQVNLINRLSSRVTKKIWGGWEDFILQFLSPPPKEKKPNYGKY
jgi:hypothetical protein